MRHFKECPETKNNHIKGIFHYYTFFIDWRHLWTTPSGKTCMPSSSFPSTITIPNFRSISLTVAEFWKRYHQNGKMRWKAGLLRWLKKLLMLKEKFCWHKHYTPWRASYGFCSKCDFLRQFQRFWSADWSPATETLSSNWIQLMWHFKIANITKNIQNPIENCKTMLMSLLSHQKIPSFSTQKDSSNGVSWTLGTSEIESFESFWVEIFRNSFVCHFLASPAAHLPLPEIQTRTDWKPH